MAGAVMFAVHDAWEPGPPETATQLVAVPAASVAAM